MRLSTQLLGGKHSRQSEQTSKFRGPEAGAKMSVILSPGSCVSNLLVISQTCRYTLGVYVNMYNIHNIDIIYVHK